MGLSQCLIKANCNKVPARFEHTRRKAEDEEKSINVGHNRGIQEEGSTYGSSGAGGTSDRTVGTVPWVEGSIAVILWLQTSPTRSG
jgi:hypothetical protein